MARVGPYDILDVLGRGGQGLVARARHAGTGELVALKLLTEPCADPEALRRFAREAEVLSRVAHPNLARFLDRGEHQGRPWLAMSLVAGRSLQALLADGPLEPARAASLLAPIARALAYLHELGLLHRDVKPANVLLEEPGGRPVLVDLGMVRREGSPGLSRSAGPALTRSGEVLGTPSFMAPEQADPGGAFGPVGPWSDVHALGVTFHALVTGRSPFERATLLGTLEHVLTAEAPALEPLVTGVTPALSDLVARALAKRAAERPSAAALAKGLEDFARGARGGRARRSGSGRRGVAVALAAALVAVVVAIGRAPSQAPIDPPGGTASPAPTPWPAAPAEVWRWRLSAEGAASPAELLAPALWEAPDLPAPLAQVLADRPGACDAAFAGDARRDPDGRVRVRYPAAALSAYRRTAGQAALFAREPLVTPDASEPTTTRLASANDAGIAYAHVGQATWRDAAVLLELRRVRAVDRDLVGIFLGSARLHAEGRTSTLGAFFGRTASARVGAVALPEGRWVPVVLEPGAPSGQRARFDGRAFPELEAVLGPCEDSRLALELEEVDVLLRGLEVRGRPSSVDRPALASPATRDEPARVAACFERLDEPATRGGPVVALLDGAGAATTLSLDGPALVLRRGAELLGRVDAAGDWRRGWLLLERQDGALLAQAGLDDAAPLTIEVGDPFGDAPTRAAWGSSGPRLRVVDAEVSGAPVAAPAAALAAWREAARDVARATCPRRLDPALCGDPASRDAGARARAQLQREVLLAAAATLERVAGELPVAAARHDALARSALAFAAAGAADDARRVVTALVERVGALAAGRAVDGLGLAPDGNVGMLEGLVTGWAPRASEEVRLACLLLARVLAPARAAEIDFYEGFVVHERGLRLRDAGDAEGAIAALEEALNLYGKAHAAGAAPHGLEARLGGVLDALGRHEDAAAAWRAAIERQPDYHWWWRSLGVSLRLLGRHEESLSATLAALAFGCGEPALVDLQALHDAGVVPRASMLAALWSALRDRPELVRQVEEQARQLLATSPEGRDGDLLALVLQRDPPPGDRPTAILARAARGDAAALEALPGVTGRDELVRHLALLHPTLARHVRR